MWPQHKVWSSLAVTSGDVWGPRAAPLISPRVHGKWHLVTTGLSRLSQHLRLRPFISLSGFLLVSVTQYWPLIGQMSLMSQQCHITQCHAELTLLSIRHENLIDTNWCIDSDHKTRLSHERSGQINSNTHLNCKIDSLTFDEAIEETERVLECRVHIWWIVYFFKLYLFDYFYAFFLHFFCMLIQCKTFVEMYL